MGTWTGQVVIVTGAASGIGRAVADLLQQKGAVVARADVAPSIADAPGGVVVDVRDAAAMRALVEGVVQKHGRLDVLFNNAGVAVGGAASALDDAQWRRILDVNLMGVVHGVQAALPQMLAQRRGHIVNTGSVAGLAPLPLHAPYVASKQAVVGMSVALRSELAALGVKVSVVCPGAVDTGIFAASDVHGVDRDRLIGMAGSKISAASCARAIVRGVDKNRALIVVTWQARLVWWAWRASPWLFELASRLAVRLVRG